MAAAAAVNVLHLAVKKPLLAVVVGVITKRF